jgi:hypothetical protein
MFKRLYHCSFCRTDSIFSYVQSEPKKPTLRAICPKCGQVTHNTVDVDALFAVRGEKVQMAAAGAGWTM